MVLLVLATSLASAQTYTEIFEGGYGNGINYSVPVFTDLDDDNLFDMIVGTSTGAMRHYEQDSIGVATFHLISHEFCDIDIGEFATPSFTDLDNDGLLDLIVGGQSGFLYHYEQDSVNSQNFTLLTNRFNDIDVEYDSAPSFVDLDGDDLLDMIVGERHGNLRHYAQDSIGSEFFTIVEDTLSNIVVGHRPRPAFTDLDNDNLLDLIIGDMSGYIRHYEQDAAGSTTFNLITDRLGTEIIHVGRYSAPTIVDLQGNGALDLIIGNYDGYVLHYESTVPGSDFTFQSGLSLGDFIDVGTKSVPAIADLNHDGKLEIIVGEEGGTLNQFNQSAPGSSTFHWYSDYFSDDWGNCSAPCLTDLDNDGFYDMIIGYDSGFLHHYEQNEVGAFVYQPDSFNGIDFGSHIIPAVIDLDGDGLLDMILGESGGMLLHYEQDTSGSVDFTLVSENFNGIHVNNNAGPCFTDLDDDGRLDLLVNGTIANIHHYEQNAPNSLDFTLVTENFNQIVVSWGRLAFADINGDGLEDIIIGSYFGDLHYFQRDGGTSVDENRFASNPSTFELMQNYPNPFNATTLITYSLKNAEKVSLAIYNMHGQRVRLLDSGYRHAGSHTAIWDGKDEKGSVASTGLYICNLSTQSFKKCIKVILMK